MLQGPAAAALVFLAGRFDSIVKDLKASMFEWQCCKEDADSFFSRAALSSLGDSIVCDFTLSFVSSLDDEHIFLCVGLLVFLRLRLLLLVVFLCRYLTRNSVQSCVTFGSLCSSVTRRLFLVISVHHHCSQQFA